MNQINGQRCLKKALIVDLSLGYGGSTSRVLTLLERSTRGTIGLACLQGGSVAKHALALGVPVHIVGKKKVDPAILLNLIQVIRKEGYELLDSQNIQAKFWASLASLLTGTTLVSTIHSWYTDEHGANSFKGRFYSGLEMKTNLGLDLYITVSKKDRQRLLEARIPEKSIELIYNAVEIDASTVKRDPIWLREKFGLEPGRVVCTAVGRLVPQKNHSVLVAAMEKAVKEVPELACIIIGVGHLENDLKKQIHELNLEKHIQLAGYLEREQVLAIIKSSDIYVMPSRYEGTPIALLEAASLGTPILSTYAGGVPEMVNNREHALLVEWDDSEDMSRSLVKLAQNKDYAQALGKAAQRHVMEVFSLEKQLQFTWQAYQKAWDKHNADR